MKRIFSIVFLLASLLSFSQQPLFHKHNKTVATGGTASDPWITTVTPSGSVRSDYSDWVGGEFIVTSDHAITITHLGRWKISTNTQTHTVRIRNSSNTTIASVSVDMSTGTAGEFVYGTLSTPVTLSAGQIYVIASEEFNLGDAWYDYENVTLTKTDDAFMRFAIYYSGGGTTLNYGASATNRMYGPLNFKYHL